jgi:hypothetical protein
VLLAFVFLLAAWTAVFDPQGDAAEVDEAAQLRYTRKSSWQETVWASRESLRSSALSEPERQERALAFWQSLQDDFPVACDWTMQDCETAFPDWFTAESVGEIETRMIDRTLHELGERGAVLRDEFNRLCESRTSQWEHRLLDLYVRACEQRRILRLKTVLCQTPRIVFTKHFTLRPSFFGYTEGQSDAQHERHFQPGASLCLLELDGSVARVRTLLHDPGGMIRDPAVSWDAARVAFAWKKSLDEDDYHLYDLELATGQVRQLTSGLGFADYEPAYLPNGDIVFSSTRCVQTVDCWWTEVSNLYTCDRDGRYLRRLGFDQVHTLYPQVLDDGRVIYLRWDYNDRSQMFTQKLFVMNSDGTGQTEFYGNNSWFPTTIGHARGIPGTQRVVCIFSGHHTPQTGKLGMLDPAKGRQENSGAQLIAPVRATEAERTDVYGQSGDLFQYPVALNQTEFLVTYSPFDWESDRAKNSPSGGFAIYWMDINGRRELLASDPQIPCNQAVPLVPRSPPPPQPNRVDYRQNSGTYYVYDVHAGLGLERVPRGVIKKLRVIALDFRPAGIGNNGSIGPSGEALVCTPISIGNGSWDVKTVLGDAKVHEDGSAFFRVPARLPVYFQALDEENRAVQTMRSWSTLQPGEDRACVGCHEHKNTTPPAGRRSPTLALQSGPQSLEPFYGPPRGFSFRKEIQPILDRHCTGCHKDREQKMTPDTLTEAVTRQRDPVWSAFAVQRRDDYSSPPAAHPAVSDSSLNRACFSLLDEPVEDKVARRRWTDSYLNLTLSRPTDYYEAVGAYFGVFDGRMVNWIGSQSIPTPLPAGAAGALHSGLLPLLKAGHGGVRLSREELDKLSCWIDLFVPFCGDYAEANLWTGDETDKFRRFREKRKMMEAIEHGNIDALVVDRPPP